MPQTSSDTEEDRNCKELSHNPDVGISFCSGNCLESDSQSDRSRSEIEEKADKVVVPGDQLVVESEEGTSTKKVESREEESLESLDSYSNCKVIREHSVDCSCLTPRLHLYLSTSHRCSSSCSLKEEGMEESVSNKEEELQENDVENPEKKFKSEILEEELQENDIEEFENPEQMFKSEILESDVAETELEDIVNEEIISIKEENLDFGRSTEYINILELTEACDEPVNSKLTESTEENVLERNPSLSQGEASEVSRIKIEDNNSDSNMLDEENNLEINEENDRTNLLNQPPINLKKEVSYKKSAFKVNQSLFKIKAIHSRKQVKLKTKKKKSNSKLDSTLKIETTDEKTLLRKRPHSPTESSGNKNKNTEFSLPTNKKILVKDIKNNSVSHQKKKAENATITSKPAVKTRELSVPKKGKKLFQINKNGTFHSFNQNLIKISCVASLKSEDEIKTEKIEFTAEIEPPKIKIEKECIMEPSNDGSSLKFNSQLKSYSSDEEETESPLRIVDNDLQCLTNIKTEPSTLSVKSEIIMEECLNEETDEEIMTDDLPNATTVMSEGVVTDEKVPVPKINSANLEVYLPDPLWTAPMENEQRSCNLCMTRFPSFMSLVDHLEKHQKDGLILCYYCQKSFGDKTSMKRHMRTHTGEKPYQCKICDKRFSLPGNFKKHRDIHEDIRTEPCEVCGKTFRRKEHLKYHLRTHTGEKPFKCSLCGSCFTARYSLQIHMNIHLGKKPYKCSYCGKAFSDKSTMRKHIRVHTGERPFTCKICDKSFGESGTLASHAATHRQERPYLCTHCNLTFKTNGGLRQHIKTHLGNKPFSCKYCGTMFLQKYNMKMHERIHTGEKPYECSECSRTFRSRSCLGKHIILHGGDEERKHSCAYCEKKFFRKAHLKRHIATHLGIKEYACDFCPKKFSTGGSMKKHLQTFHSEGARSFPCMVCGRVFKRRIYVATHKCGSSMIKMEPDD